MASFWKKIDRIGVETFPCRLEDDDICFYARDYISEGGYQASEANNLISNLKKSPLRKGRPEWIYRERAVTQFAREISAITNLENFLITCIPSSKTEDDPEYDNRLQDTLASLKNLRPNITVEFPLSIRVSTTAAHLGGSRRTEDFYNNLVWSGTESEITDFILIDDVITTGGHFKACKKMILDHIPNANIFGMFWGKTVWPDSQ